MKTLPLTDDLIAVAPNVIWFEPPEQALADPARFMAYLMTYGTLEDILVVKRHMDEVDFRDALDQAPPGIFDARSWTYWNLMAGRSPPPPMPRRSFGRIPDAISLPSSSR